MAAEFLVPTPTSLMVQVNMGDVMLLYARIDLLNTGIAGQGQIYFMRGNGQGLPGGGVPAGVRIDPAKDQVPANYVAPAALTIRY